MFGMLIDINVHEMCLNLYGWRETHNALIMLILCSSSKQNADNYTTKIRHKFSMKTPTRIRIKSTSNCLRWISEFIEIQRAITVVTINYGDSAERTQHHSFDDNDLICDQTLKFFKFAIYVINLKQAHKQIQPHLWQAIPFLVLQFKIALRSCTEHFRHNNMMSFRLIPRDFPHFLAMRFEVRRH